MARYFRWDLVTRFASAIRQEGFGAALNRVRLYLSRQRQGGHSSVLGGGGSGSNAPAVYMQGIWGEMARGGGFHTPRDLSRGPRIALIGDLNLPQCRKYRIEQLAAFWTAQGIPCDYAHYEDNERAVELLQNATHLFEYRLEISLLTTMYRYEARRLGLPVLYDIDDPLFSISAYETYHNMSALDPAFKTHFLSVAPRYAEMMNSADMVSVSTPGLAEHARLYTNRPVHVRRNFADADTLNDGAGAMARAAGAQDGLFRVVFASGSQGHEADFDLIGDMLAAFITADPNRRLVILGHFKPAHLSGALAAQTDFHPFTDYDVYLEKLATADVAVMPLQDDQFNRCKSGVRVIDAASVGLPAIVSNVGDLPNLVIEGETGFVASTPQEWRTALETLASDPQKMATMRKAARHTLETRWSGQPDPHVIAPEILEWVQT